MATVTLRARRDSDEDALYALVSDLDTWELRSPRAPAPLTLAAFRERQAAREEGVDFVIEVDGAFAGQIGAFGEDPLARHAEIGMALVAGLRGQGIGTAALRQVVEFCFVRRNLRRVHTGALATNLASIGACRRVGFVEEGRQREHAWIRGEYVDEVKMGLLRSEWERA